MTTRKPHEDRLQSYLEIFLGPKSDQELSMPRDALRIDAVWDLAEVDDTLGPVAPFLRHRRVSVEGWSGRVALGALASAMVKAAWLGRERLQRKRADRRGRPPLMFIITAKTIPRAVSRRAFEMIEPGLYQRDFQPFYEIVVLELARFRQENGTTGLHLLATPSETDGASRLEAFLDDPTVDETIRGRVREAIMNQSIPSTEHEHMTAAQRIEAKGMAKGMAKGRAKGRAEGRAKGRAEGMSTARTKLVAHVRDRLGEEAARELEGIDDFDTLCARALELHSQTR